MSRSNNWILFFTILLSVFSLLLFIGCGETANNNNGGGYSVTEVRIIPYQATAYIGNLVTYSATAMYGNGATVSVTTTAAWTVTNSVGSVTQGTFSAEAEGSGEVRATYASLTGIAYVTVSASTPADTLVSIEVTTSSDMPIRENEDTTFTATGYLADGSTSSLTGVVWSTDGIVGTIESSTGVFYPNAQGNGYIYATTEEVVGSPIQGTYEVQVSGYRIKFIANANAYVDSTVPGGNYDTEQTMKVKLDSGDEMWTFLNFDLSSIPGGSTIDSVTLYYNVFGSPNDDTSYAWAAVDSSWTESGVTYTLASGYSYSVTYNGTFTVPSAGGSGSITATKLKELVEAWIAGTQNQYGIRFNKPGSDGDFSFNSRTFGTDTEKPYLQIDYD